MRPFRSTSAAALLLVLAAGSALAQGLPIPKSGHGPTVWVAGGAALFGMQGFSAGRDGAFWDFDVGWQLRAGVERNIRRQMTAGLAATYGRLPVSVTGGECNGCSGHAGIWQGLATLHVGGGDSVGFSSSLEVTAGVIGFEQFADEDEGVTGAERATTDPYRDVVPSFSAAYGLVYGLWPGLELSLVQEVGIFVYKPVKNARDSKTVPLYSATRLQVRYALPRR